MSAAVIPFRVRAAGSQAALRARIAATLETTLTVVDELVSMLDRLDGDPDLEDGGEAEPRLAALVGTASQRRWCGFDDPGGAA